MLFWRLIPAISGRSEVKSCTSTAIFEFHDFRADGLEQKTIELWLKKVPWELLLNKRGQTWRNLEDPRKDKLDQLIAIELMLANPTLIKRPVVSYNNDVMVGFKEQDYVTYFGK